MKGFSLIEILIAVAIFTFVAMLSIGSLLILTTAEKRVAGIQTSQDNVRFAVEAMAREIRTGALYRKDDHCGGSIDCFQFTNASKNGIVYKLSSDSTQCSPGTPSDSRCLLKSLGEVQPYGSFLFSALNPLTGSDVSIDDLRFLLSGELSGGDDFQVRVTIIMRAVARKNTKNETKIDIQTTVSQLKLDI